MYYFNTEGFLKLNNLVYNSNYSKIIIITDVNTQSYCLPVFRQYIDFDYLKISINSGDENKNINTLQYLWKELLSLGVDRSSLIINLGGGVITDIGGFVASTFKRGIDFIHIPTSLLGMIDASIGGKNGINFQHIKNQIGVINLPKLIVINEEFLKTLPTSEFDSGFAEMLKHSLIADRNYWKELMDFKTHNKGSLIELIKKSVQIKDHIILQDPYEKGMRKALNYGHTLGHAIESHLNYSIKMPISHGHAVAIGTILVSYISSKKLSFKFTDVKRVKTDILSVFEKISFDAKNINEIIDLLQFDKKNIGGEVMFVLLKDIGTPIFNQVVSNSLIKEAFEFYLS